MLPRNHVNLAIALVAVVCAGTLVPQTPLATSLLVIAVVAEAFTIQFRGVRISGLALPRSSLAMALLGPLPAAAIGGRECRLREPDRQALLARAGLERAHVRRDSRLLGGWMLTLVGREDPIAFAACVVLVFLVTNALAFTSVATYLRLTGVLSVSEAYSTVYRTMLPFELATALLTAGVGVHLRAARDRRDRAAGRRAARLPSPRAHGREGLRAREELARRTEELGALQVGRALDRAADAVDARRDDRAPLGRRRPLLARGRARLGLRRARAGPDPHRRAAARHRQVHPPGRRPVRRTAS